MDPALKITSPDAIRALADELSVWRVDRRQLSVDLPSLDEGANEDLQRRINLHRGACGCGSGRLAGVATMATFILLLATGVLSWSALGWWRIVGLYFLASVLMSFVAKVIGLHRSRRALWRIADEPHHRALAAE
jgi:hypothetical protein